MMGFHLFSQALELRANVNPSTLNTAGANGELTSNNATASPSGGKAPFTFAWSRVSGDVFTITQPVGATTEFIASGTDENKGGLYKCVITDDNLDTAEDTVQVNFTFGMPP